MSTDLTMPTRRLRVIACEIFFRELCALAADAPFRIDFDWLPKGLHDIGSVKMLAAIQERVDAVRPEDAEVIALAYGLCSNGVHGLVSPHLPLVIPKAHDCITLFLGSRAAYARRAAERPGTYYLTSGWLERGAADGPLADQAIGRRCGLEKTLAELTEEYGEDNAQYLYETLRAGAERYDTLAYISLGLFPEERFLEFASARAAERGWRFECLTGDPALLRGLLHGPWNPADYLLLAPGQTLEATPQTDAILTAR